MDKVGAKLEVGLTDDDWGVIIRHPNLKPDASSTNRIVLSPRQARYLANLLIENAEFSETVWAIRMLPSRDAESKQGTVFRVPNRKRRGRPRSESKRELQ